MKNTYVLTWYDEPSNYKTLHMESFKTESQARDYAIQNKINDYDISYWQ